MEGVSGKAGSVSFIIRNNASRPGWFLPSEEGEEPKLSNTKRLYDANYCSIAPRSRQSFNPFGFARHWPAITNAVFSPRTWVGRLVQSIASAQMRRTSGEACCIVCVRVHAKGCFEREDEKREEDTRCKISIHSNTPSSSAAHPLSFWIPTFHCGTSDLLHDSVLVAPQLQGAATGGIGEILLFCSPGWPQDFVVLSVFCARFPPREASYTSSNYTNY